LIYGGKEENHGHWSLVRSIGFVIEFVIKLSCLGTLRSFIEFRDSLGLETHLMDLWMKYGKVGEC